MEDLVSVIQALQNRVKRINDKLGDITWKIQMHEEITGDSDEVNVGELSEKITKLKDEAADIETEIHKLNEIKQQMFSAIEDKIAEVERQKEKLQEQIIP